MPANLPKEAKVKYQKVLEARTKEEKLKALQEYLSAIPKHKGTENLVAQVRHQIAKLKREIQEEKELKKRLSSRSGYNIKKEGDLQYVLIGFTKSGKSSIISKITNAKVEISEREFTTTKPYLGMLNYEGVLIQLIDTPSLMEGNEDWNNIIFSLVRSADGLVIVLDGSLDIIEQYNKIKEILKENGILIGKRKFYIKLRRSPFNENKILLFGKVKDVTEENLYKVLKDYGIKNVILEFYGEASLDEFEKALVENIIFKPSIILINKADLLKDFPKFDFDGIPYLYCSSLTNLNLEKIGELIFISSGMIRVYTKEPNEKEPSKKPLVIRKGTTVIEVAEEIHRDLAKLFKYARVWGKSVKIQGEKVGPNHVLEDGDIIEIRT